MSKEQYFRIVSNKTQVIKDVEFTDEWLLFSVDPMYQDQVQEFVREFGKPIDDLSDMDEFTMWMQKEKNVECWSIPKIYYIENNGEPYKEVIS